MFTFIVKVYKSPLHLRKSLYFELQGFANVMTFPETHVFRQNNVHLYQEIIAKMKSSNGVNQQHLQVGMNNTCLVKDNQEIDILWFISITFNQTTKTMI